ncbi:MAG TPA: sugar phosphate isomerase/epimerase [Chthoniobacterales bacterium]|nr:sugar phosphate isomerase/epimerase [Chthoniobacterales bacterium]
MYSCFNTITAGRKKPLEEIIDACGAAQFAGIEIDLDHLDAAAHRISLREIRGRLADVNLEPTSVMAFDLAPLADDLVAIDRFKRGVEAAHSLGSPLLLVYCATDIPAGMKPDEARAKASQRAKLYAELAGPIHIGLEPIGRTTLMGRPEEALGIAQGAAISNLGIVMDTFHFYRAGVTDLRACPVDKFLMVHVNDAEDLPIEQLKDANRLHLGRGILPLESYLRTLAERQYDGFLSIEIFRPEYWEQPVTQVVSEAKESLDKLLEKIGVDL